MDDNTKKIIADLKKAGLDLTDVERQLQVNPIVNKNVDQVIGNAGILRQSDYQRYMNAVKAQEEELKTKAQQLATLHDASKTTTLPKEALDTITALEEALIETGMFTPDSIKEISLIGKTPLIEMTKKPENNNANPNNDNGNNGRGNEMPNDKIDLSGYVDTKTYEESLANVAYGSIATGLKIQAKIDEAKALGIAVTPQKVTELENHLRQGFATGQSNLDEIFEKTFEISKVKETKSNEALEARINEEANKRVAERMKTENLPSRRNIGRPAPVFNRSPAKFVDTSAANNSYADDQGNIDVSKLPKNEVGDPKLFLARGDRSSRVAKASDSYGVLMDKLEGDPLYD